MNSFYLDAIRKFEGFAQKAEWDYAQHTNGYGTRALYPNEVIDRAEAERRFQSEISEARAIVERNAPTADEGTKAALTSLTFNAGDKWTRSGLGAALRQGDIEAARELFLQYNKAGGQILPGLAARRATEADWIGNPQGAAASGSPVAIGAVATEMRSATADISENPKITHVEPGRSARVDDILARPSVPDRASAQMPLPLASRHVDDPSGEAMRVPEQRFAQASMLLMLLQLDKVSTLVNRENHDDGEGNEQRRESQANGVARA
jgi:lysozyme